MLHLTGLVYMYSRHVCTPIAAPNAQVPHNNSNVNKSVEMPDFPTTVTNDSMLRWKQQSQMFSLQCGW